MSTAKPTRIGPARDISNTAMLAIHRRLPPPTEYVRRLRVKQQSLLKEVRSSSSVFEKLPINIANEEFRLWQFLEDSSEERLHLHMEAFAIDDCPPYIALSYVWGPHDDARLITIDSGGSLKVTKNLWDFLVVLFAEQPQPALDIWFWADQISIDQQVIDERGHQVGLMGYIFNRAKRVFAYLGPEPHPSILDVQCLKDLKAGPRDMYYWLRDRQERHWLTSIYLFTRYFWSRLWIVQELRLAAAIVFWCGRYPLDLEGLRQNFDEMIARETHVMRTIEGSRSIQCRELLELARDFYNGQCRTIEHLLQRQGAPPDGLLSALLSYGRNQCSDIRDKIFGLQAIVVPDERISIDYSKPFGQLLREVMERWLAERIGFHAWGASGIWILNEVQCERIADVAAVLTETSLDYGRMVRWAYVAGSIKKRFSGSQGGLNVLADHVTVDWRRILETLGHLVVTDRQKELTKRLNDQLTPVATKLDSFITLWLDDPEKSLSDLPQALRDYYAKDLADDLCHVLNFTIWHHGFVMMGDFLYHPEEIPFAQFQQIAETMGERDTD